MMVDFFRWARGYVYFEARGKKLERFIGLCLKERLFLWSPKKEGERLTGFMTAGDYRRIRPCARQSRTRVRVAKKGGLPFVLRRFRRRPGLFIGLFLSLGMLYLSTFFLWDVEFVGNGKIPTDELAAFLAERGVAAGTFKPTMNVKEVQEEAILHFSDLSWIAVNVMGGKARVEVREGTPVPDRVNHTRPQNLVAAKAGEILRVEDYDGQAVVQPGDQVLPGDLLISGILEDASGKVTLRQALGEVVAKTRYEREITVPLFETQNLPTGRLVKRYVLRIYGLELPLYFDSKPPFALCSETAYLHEWKPFDHFFGLAVREEIFHELEPCNVSHTEAEAKEMAQVLLEADLTETLPDVKIVKRELSASCDAFVYTLRAKIFCEERIEIPKEILWGD